MKDFFQTARFKALLAACVLLAGIMAYAGANGRLRAAPQEVLAAALTPLQKVAAVCSDGISGIVDRFLRLDSIVEENDALKQENAELRAQLVELDRYKAENDAFRHANNIKEEHPDYTLLPGFVIGRDALDRFYSFTIDLGTKHGVQKYDVVVSEYGYLVGVVLDATYTSSKVITILNPSLNAACMVSRTRDNGIVTGSDLLAAEGLFVMNNLPRSTQAAPGDQVITTGLGEVFPAGLLVGNIQAVEPEVSGQSMVAKVQPGEDIAGIKQVSVILNSARAAAQNAEKAGSVPESEPQSAPAGE